MSEQHLSEDKHNMQSEDNHTMETEPEVGGHAIRKSFNNFLIAIVIIVLLTAGSLVGLYQLAAQFPEVMPWAVTTKNTAESLTDDIPLYKGAVLSDSTGGSSRQTYTYMLPLGAQTTARAFYAEEMPKLGWKKLAGGSTYLSFYKDEGRRRVTIQVVYTKSHVTLEFEITNKGG